MNEDLIAVSKDGEYLEVNRVALLQHKHLGWRECEKREPAKIEEEPADKAAEKPAKKAEKPADKAAE